MHLNDVSVWLTSSCRFLTISKHVLMKKILGDPRGRNVPAKDLNDWHVAWLATSYVPPHNLYSPFPFQKGTMEILEKRHHLRSFDIFPTNAQESYPKILSQEFKPNQHS